MVTWKEVITKVSFEAVIKSTDSESETMVFAWFLVTPAH
jgi:hypothetical protein